MATTDATTPTKDNASPDADSSHVTSTVVQGPGWNLSLCETCLACFTDADKQIEFARDVGFFHGSPVADVGASSTHHKTYQSWQKAIQEGCHICKRLGDLVSDSAIDEWNQHQASRHGQKVRGLVRCELSYPPEPPYNISIKIAGRSLDLAAWPANTQRHTTTIHDVGETTSSDSAWATASTWIQNCVQTHESCAPTDPEGAGWYPTRLLDLGVPNSGASSIKLIETARSQPEGTYITLSHCWGGKTPVILTKENRSNFFDEIQGLPKTFDDAVEATRKLGVRYIWIDSLCIVQNDSGDWAKEAALMGKVYRFALCNLSATAARNSNGGLFSNRGNRRLVGQMVLNIRESHGTLFYEKDFFTYGVEQSPLQERGWVLQERILSPRILHFAEKQLFWECSEICACEAFPNGILRGVTYERLRDIALPSTEPANAWNIIVERYTKRSLTFGSDKLPALSGIAKWFGSKLGGQYLAGIWDNAHLPRHLAWYIDIGSSKPRSRPDYRAPTWSWASVDDPVSFPEWGESGYKPLIKIVSKEINPVNDDPMGAVASGYILVEGSLFKIPSGSRETLFQGCDVKFDAEPEPTGDLYLLPLYMDAGMDYEKDRKFGHMVSQTRYLVLVSNQSDSFSFSRCGFAIAKKGSNIFSPFTQSKFDVPVTRKACDDSIDGRVRIY